MYESGPNPGDGSDDGRDEIEWTADAAADEDGLARQVELYGEPLSALFLRLQDTYRISESRLAAVVGISTPMLGQLTSGERAKISNPAVLRRLQRLDEQGRSPEVRSGDPARLLAVLSQVAVATPLRTTRERIGHLTSSRESAAVYLGDIAVVGDLRRAAAAVPSTDLAALLLEAARRLQ